MKLKQYVFHTLLLSLLVAAAVFGQSAKPAATGKPERIVIKPESLPKPYQTDSARNFPRTTPAPANASLQLPPGFAISVFAEGDFGIPRWIIEPLPLYARIQPSALETTTSGIPFPDRSPSAGDGIVEPLVATGQPAKPDPSSTCQAKTLRPSEWL